MLCPGWQTGFHVHDLLTGQFQAMGRVDCKATFRLCHNMNEAEFAKH